jgi:thioredoxin-dependent peroxiredoxin
MCSRPNPGRTDPNLARLVAGDRAPDLTLESGSGTVTLSRLPGRVVLYFYPKDDTPGCTTEACEFQSLRSEIAAAGATIVGVSPDSVKRHAKFRAKYELEFALLSDPDHVAAEAYGVWIEKSLYGRRYMGVERSTFVVGPDGTLEAAHYGVAPAGHAAAVLERLRG